MLTADATGRAGAPAGLGDHRPIVPHERDIGSLERHAAPGRAHRDADVGLGERGAVVHAVAHHHHHRSLGLGLPDGGDLVLRQQPRAELEPELAGDRGRDPLVIAREQEQPAYAETLQLPQRGRHLGPDRVGDPQQAGHSPVIGGEEHGLPRALQHLGPCLVVRGEIDRVRLVLAVHAADRQLERHPGTPAGRRCGHGTLLGDRPAVPHRATSGTNICMIAQM